MNFESTRSSGGSQSTGDESPRGVKPGRNNGTDGSTGKFKSECDDCSVGPTSDAQPNGDCNADSQSGENTDKSKSYANASADRDAGKSRSHSEGNTDTRPNGQTNTCGAGCDPG